MNHITNFWNHFKQNNFVFLLLNEIPKDEIKINFDKLITMLHHYNKDLDLIIKNKNNGAELIITANGNPYLFKEVELLVHYAPVVERWKITAFLQPETNLTKYQQGKDKPLEYYGISLRISDMYFTSIENLEKQTDLGIRIYLKNYIILKENPVTFTKGQAWLLRKAFQYVAWLAQIAMKCIADVARGELRQCGQQNGERR